jgi:hypothetical protein
MKKQSHELLPLARQTSSGLSIRESETRRTERSSSQPNSQSWSGDNARAESAATARITRISTAVHTLGGPLAYPVNIGAIKQDCKVRKNRTDNSKLPRDRPAFGSV